MRDGRRGEDDWILWKRESGCTNLNVDACWGITNCRPVSADDAAAPAPLDIVGVYSQGCYIVAQMAMCSLRVVFCCVGGFMLYSVALGDSRAQNSGMRGRGA